jgi:hypothetical protein
MCLVLPHSLALSVCLSVCLPPPSLCLFVHCVSLSVAIGHDIFDHIFPVSVSPGRGATFTMHKSLQRMCLRPLYDITRSIKEKCTCTKSCWGRQVNTSLLIPN